MKYNLLCWLNDFWYTTARVLFGKLFYLAARCLILLNLRALALKFLLASLRYGENSKYISTLKKLIGSNNYIADLISTGVGQQEAAVRSIIVRWPVYKEKEIIKGVIIITFTRTFSYYLRNINLEEMSKHFIFVLEPSWSGYADPDILGFIGRAEGVIVQASAIEDRVLLNAFSDTFIPASFGASDWVDINIFKKIDIEKKYDSIYIANTNPIKRVKRYLDAISEIVKSDSSYLGCLVCASWGGMESLVKRMVGSYGLENNIELRFSLSREQVIEALNMSKVNILLSYKEGSNRSLFEAIFCDVPVICISENVGVNKSYINEFTGMLISDVSLEYALLWMKKNYTSFSPRNWGLENISPVATTGKLNKLIESRFGTHEQGQPLLQKTNNPEVSYFIKGGLAHQQYVADLLSCFLLGTNSDSKDHALKIRNIEIIFRKDLEKVCGAR